MNEATQKEREYAQELNDSQFEKIKEYAKTTGKLEIYELTPEQRAAWKKAVSKIYPEFYNKNLIGKDLIEGALNTK